MGRHLDLDDVAGGHPVAERELADLRARANKAEAERDALQTHADMWAAACGAVTEERDALRAELAEAHAQIDRLGLGVPYVEPDEEVK